MEDLQIQMLYGMVTFEMSIKDGVLKRIWNQADQGSNPTSIVTSECAFSPL